jgi:hypothetical protein
VCLGLAASAAVIIFVGGRKGRRFTLPHSRFLIHQPSSFSQGPASDIEITANEIIKIRDTYNLVLSEETGRPDKQILKDVHRDFWLHAPGVGGVRPEQRRGALDRRAGGDRQGLSSPRRRGLGGPRSGHAAVACAGPVVRHTPRRDVASTVPAGPTRPPSTRPR